MSTMYDVRSDAVFEIQSKSVKNLHFSYLYLDGKYRATFWTKTNNLSLSLLSLGKIHLSWKYFVCSSNRSMLSERKTAWKQAVLCYKFHNVGRPDQNENYEKTTQVYLY